MADIPPPLGFIFSLYANNGFYLFRRFSRLLGLMSISCGDYRSFIFQVRLPCTMPTAKRCERQGVVSCLSLHILALGRSLRLRSGREPTVQGRCVPCTHRIVVVCIHTVPYCFSPMQLVQVALWHKVATWCIRSRLLLAKVENHALHNIA